MKNGLMIIIIVVFFSCSDDNMDKISSSDLKGKWIEVETRSDTLSFDTWDNKEIMILGRGKEMRDGNLLPKYGSGPYEYKLTEGKISLHWTLSSDSSFTEYSLNIISDNLHIGNFFASSSGETLTFIKLE